MSEDARFLNALFGSYEGQISFVDIDGNTIESTEVPNLPDLMIAPSAGDKTFFVFGVKPEAKAEDFKECLLAPSASLFKDGSLLLIWAFDEPVAKNDPRLIELAESMVMGLDEPIPMPGTDGWTLNHADAEVYYTLDAMHEAYGPLPEQEATMYGDAKVLAPYNPEDYEKTNITVTLGSRRESKQWAPKTMPLAALIQKLCKHEEGQKDGPAIVYADMVPGQRVKAAVKRLTAIGLDIDTGTPGAEIDAALKELGCLALRYTTHSHFKTETDFKKDNVLKWAPNAEIDTDLMRKYVKEKHQWDQRIADSVEFEREDHTEKGIVVIINHNPMHKHRVILPLKTSFNIADEGKTQKEATDKWAKVPEAIANKLGVPFDKTGTDPCRLFYLPRHAKTRPFEITLFGGPLFDWNSLSLFGEFDNIADDIEKKGSKSVTKEGRDLGRWSREVAAGFQIVDILEEFCSDKVRTPASNGYNIECPFDEDHSNAGDPEDQACFAVNAADGTSEIFTISCRHESCRDKTNLDMLGKMLKDEWFPKDVLTDAQYDLTRPNDPAPKSEPVSGAEPKEEDTTPAYLVAIEALHPKSTPEEHDNALALLIEANLNAIGLSTALEVMRKKTKATAVSIKGTYRKVYAEIKGGTKEKTSDNQGRKIFRYEGSGFNFHDATDLCQKTLLADNQKEKMPVWSHMEGVPVRLVTDPKTGKITFREYDPSALWSALNAKIVFTRKVDNKDGPLEAVDEKVARQVYNDFIEAFQPAPEILYTPLFANDGILINKPGFYGGKQYPNLNLMLPASSLDVGEIPKHPTAEEALEAVRWIKEELLVDFPFLDFDLDGKERREPSEANAIAMLVTGFMRRMIQGVTPVFFVSKPTPGAGGSLLGKIPMYLADGVVLPPARYSQNEEEMNKSLIAEIMHARNQLFFDDVKEFNNRELLRAITSQRIGGRVLGGSSTIQRDNNFLWVATGNNPYVLSEMERRVVWIKINPKVADVQTRTYKHNLEPWLLGQKTPEVIEGTRPIAVRNILIMIQYWVSLGMPLFRERTRASFEDWAAKVGGVLQSVGVEGFLDNRKEAGQDMDEAVVKNFVRDWVNKFHLDKKTTPIEAFKWALETENDILDGVNEDQKKARFMKRLPTIEGRVFSINGRNLMMGSGYDKDHNACYFVGDIGATEVAAA